MNALTIPKLRPGDTVAVASPSWGGPAVFPHVFDAGVRVLRERFGLRVKELPHTRASPSFLATHPEARAADLHEAIADPDVKGIIASIGGDDSVRLLPLLDTALMRAHPKLLIGFSDTTTLLVFARRLGWVTFHGPSVMAGFAQAESLPDAFTKHLRAVLFGEASDVAYRPFSEWSDGTPDWTVPANATALLPMRSNRGPRWLQGQGTQEGELFGGCLEVLEFLKGTRFWPEPEFWAGKVLFFETSEEAPSPAIVGRWLRNYALQGAFERASALLIGRPNRYLDETKQSLEREVLRVVVDEFGRRELPIVMDLDFGHTYPQWVMPIGRRLRVDCDRRELTLLAP